MIAEQAFIATNRAQPFECGPRLVHADWLEEQGEAPRAELMRMLNQLYTSPPADPDAKQTLIRQISGMSVHGPLHAEPFFLNSVVILMRRVEAGTFWMGLPGDGQVEIPQAFYLGMFQVTQGEWQTVMSNNPNSFSLTGELRDKVKRISKRSLARFPVESVTWKNVQEFLIKLNALARVANETWTYYLPSEAEWEFSCRAGASSHEECSFWYYLDKPIMEVTSKDMNY